MVPLSDIHLVNTNGIDPKDALLLCVAQVPESCIQVLGNFEVLALH
jgi:hypothetical protein